MRNATIATNIAAVMIDVRQIATETERVEMVTADENVGMIAAVTMSDVMTEIAIEVEIIGEIEMMIVTAIDDIEMMIVTETIVVEIANKIGRIAAGEVVIAIAIKTVTIVGIEIIKEMRSAARM